jgi:fumarate reductase subunit C
MLSTILFRVSCSHLLSKNIKIEIYKTIVLPVVLYGCKTWFLMLGKENRLRVFENRVLRRIFGPKIKEGVEGWRSVHNEELHNFHASPVVVVVVVVIS